MNIEKALLVLKDVKILNIKDDLEEFTEFGSTFGGDNEVTMHNFELDLEDGRIVTLESVLLNYYGSTTGINNTTNFMATLLRMVARGEEKNLTLAEFIEWIVQM